MARRAWLIALVAVLFGLKAPLCIWACMEQASPTVATDSYASNATPPCHGQDETPADDSRSGDHDCDCETVQIVFSKSGVSEASPHTSSSSVAAHRVLRLATSLAEPPLPAVSGAPGRLPSPDILLLKSTLLI